MKEKWSRVLLLTGMTLLAYACSALMNSASGETIGFFSIGLAVVFCVFCFLAKRTAFGDEKKASLLALIGVYFVGLVFILMLPYDNSWHDLGSFAITETDVGDGHLGYIRWIMERGLPLQNPMTEGNSILYHPPLSQLLNACIVKFGLLLGLSQEAALESMQVLGLLYVVGFALSAGLLCRELGAKDVTCALSILLCGTTPIVLLLGTVPNNDLLMVWLMTLCAVYTLRWIQFCRTASVIGMALTLGFGMAAKLNAALLIPCIGVLFVLVLIQKAKQKQVGKLIGQYAVFLLCSVPEAVVWPLYHMLKYQMPLNYIRDPAATQNVSSWSLWERFGIPSGVCLRKLFYTGIRKTDHNVWMQTLKTAMFDEKTLFEEGTWQWYAAYLLMALFALLCLLLLVSFVIWLVRNAKSSKDAADISAHRMGIFLGLYIVVLLGSYILFCIQYPNMCSFNFRYLLSIMPLLAAGLYLWEGNRVGRTLFSVMIVGFAVGVCACYGYWFFLM